MAIVVSIIADTFDEIARRALRQAKMADLVEVRLDRVGHPGTEALAELCRACDKPVIVACPGAEAFGAFRGTLDERLDLLHDAAAAGARFCDIDYRISLELGELEGSCSRIVSRHELEDTPSDLAAVHEEVQAVLYEGDVTKIVTHARSCEDGLDLLAWLRTTRGVVAFCSGAKGSFTRVLAPIFGSPFSYCAPSIVPGETPGEATAPGQLRVADLRGMLPPGGVSQETAILGVVGRPVHASWSPRVQGMALKAAFLDAVYVAFEPDTLEGFLARTQDENYRGFSVTAPFKEEAFRLAAERDVDAERARAVNTLVREKAGWRGTNTDVGAVRETLEGALAIHHRRQAGEPDGPSENAQGSALCGARVLVLGTGGAARAVLVAASSAGARCLVAGRRADAARTLAAELGCEPVEWDAIPATEHEVLVQATPVGSTATGAGESVVPAEWIRPETVVLDAVYRPIRTALLVAAAERGCTPVPGGEWFVRQATEQFRRFTKSEPNEELMRLAFEHAHEETSAGAE